MKILVVDNYDSFTYNLVYVLRQLDISIEVYRNDKITPNQAQNFDGIVLSPGPGIPEESGYMPAIIEQSAGLIPILGICLGHQAIAQYLGAELINTPKVYHGIKTQITQVNGGSPLFINISEQFYAGRYHSWEVNRKNLPPSLEVTAIAEKDNIMALQNQEKQLYGLQFHPESIMTSDGPTLIKNFINVCKRNKA